MGEQPANGRRPARNDKTSFFIGLIRGSSFKDQFLEILIIAHITFRQKAKRKVAIKT